MRLITNYFKSWIIVLGVLSFIYGGILSINHIEANGIDVIDETNLVIDAQETDDKFVKKSDELPYLFSAFFITWVVLFAYIFIIARNRKEIETELYTLKNSLEDRDDE